MDERSINPMKDADIQKGRDPRQELEAYVIEGQRLIAEAVKVLGYKPETDPAIVLPKPEEVRDDAIGLELSEDQEESLRSIAGEFGIGGEVDVRSQATHQLIEGGKPWKVEAEVAISSEAAVLLFAGSPNRKIGNDELDYVANKTPGDQLAELTEYEMVRQLAELQPGFVPLKPNEVLPYGYDMDQKHQLVEAETGQLVKIGTIGDQEVILLRVDREDYVDEEGNNKYRNQPDSAALMGLVSDILAAEGDGESSVGMNTSSTYASRVIDAKRAGLKRNRNFDVGMYGRETLARVRGADVASPAPINQIPGELRVIHKKLQLLKGELSSPQED
jgi:hypothetical protein